MRRLVLVLVLSGVTGALPFSLTACVAPDADPPPAAGAGRGTGGRPSSTSAGAGGTAATVVGASGGSTGTGAGGISGSERGTGGGPSATGGTGGRGSSASGGAGAGTAGRGTGGTNGSGGAAAGGRAGTGGSGSGGSASNVMQPPPITNGSPGWASRYWDCCKPACAWKANVRTGNPMTSCNQQNQNLSSADVKNACDGGSGGAFMCWNASPWSLSDSLSYGFVAASSGNYVCGRCYQLQFTGSGHSGSNPGATSLSGKTMIVQVINNGGVAGDQMDILIPGGGVGALNACSTQWGNVDLGAQFGGFYLACKNDKACTQQMCLAAFAGKPDLQAGCDWFLGWFNGADNPNFVFKQVSCPAAVTQRSGLSDPG
jgi:Glycosyl hydrolase family 45